MKNSINLLLLSLLLHSCSSVHVKSDYDHQTDFSQYKTYSLTPGSEQLEVNELVRKRIISSVITQMNAKGFTRSNSNPDLMVDLMVKTQAKQTTKAVTTNFGGSYGRRFRFGTAFTTTHLDVDTYIEGTLIIGMVDNAKNELIWEGTGTTTVTKSTTKDEEINKAVTKIMASFPPPAKK